MNEITLEYAKANNLKFIAKIRDGDMSKIILKMERLSEYNAIKYYSMDTLVFDVINHSGFIEVSFWCD